MKGHFYINSTVLKGGAIVTMQPVAFSSFFTWQTLIRGGSSAVRCSHISLSHVSYWQQKCQNGKMIFISCSGASQIVSDDHHWHTGHTLRTPDWKKSSHLSHLLSVHLAFFFSGTGRKRRTTCTFVFKKMSKQIKANQQQPWCTHSAL